MESNDKKYTSDHPSFNNYRDPKCRSRKIPRVTSIIKNSTHPHCLRKVKKITCSRYYTKVKYVPQSDFPSSPRIKRTTLNCINSTASHSKFKKREITTIHEEILLFKTSKSHSSRKEKKDYKDKVASLKNIVKRLREMGVAKAENTQNKLPDDFTRQLSSIQLQ